MPRQRQPVIGFGVLLLAHRLLQTGFQHIPPVTLIAILSQVALYLGFINPPWDRYEVCLSGESILYYKDYRRLFLSVIEHADDFHLYHNMASFILKGRTLESRYGSLRFTILLLVFIFSTSGMYVALSKALYMYFDDYSYMKQCAIGFSGVLFALKVLTTFESGERSQWIHGFVVPTKYAVWVELLIIHILVPRASFIGHLAGILVGVLYLHGPFRIIVEALHSFIRGTLFPRASYTYAHGSTAFHPSSGYRHEAYGWNNYDINQDDVNQDFLDSDELRRRRLNRFN